MWAAAPPARWWGLPHNVVQLPWAVAGSSAWLLSLLVLWQLWAVAGSSAWLSSLSASTGSFPTVCIVLLAVVAIAQSFGPCGSCGAVLPPGFCVSSPEFLGVPAELPLQQAPAHHAARTDPSGERTCASFGVALPPSCVESYGNSSRRRRRRRPMTLMVLWAATSSMRLLALGGLPNNNTNN